MKTNYFILLLLLGSACGIGVYTFFYAHGLSYLSAEPKACVNCHIMRPQYDNWLKSSHHTAAGCSDCHMPSSMIPKYLTKAENGFRHSLAFTLQNFHEPIQIRKGNKLIVNQACQKCHGELIGHAAAGRTAADELDRCTRCHSAVGH